MFAQCHQESGGIPFTRLHHPITPTLREAAIASTLPHSSPSTLHPLPFTRPHHPYPAGSRYRVYTPPLFTLYPSPSTLHPYPAGSRYRVYTPPLFTLHPPPFTLHPLPIPHSSPSTLHPLLSTLYPSPT